MEDLAVVLIIALFALIIIGAFAVYRRRANVRIKGPLGMGLELEAQAEEPPPPPPEPKPGVNIQDAKSRSGGILAEDKTGRGVNVERAEVETDILASSEGPADKEPPGSQEPDADPKA